MSNTIVEPKVDSDRYRTLLYRHLIRQAAVQAIADSGGRTTFLLPLIEPHLMVREDGDRFTVVVVDKDTGLERPNVSIADVLAEMRCSEELSGARRQDQSRLEIHQQPICCRHRERNAAIPADEA